MFVQANSYREANRRTGDIHRLVWHTAEIQERRDAAEDVAAFFAKPSTGVSAHWCIDNNTAVQCVQVEDIAFHALGDNTDTVGFELSGFARQTHDQWRDAYSQKVLQNVAELAAELAHQHKIPVRWLTEAELRRREKGFTTHRLVSRVFGEGTRTDPGAEFPYGRQLNLVEAELQKLQKVVSWKVEYMGGNGKPAEDTTKDWTRWAANHPGAGQRGKVVFRPKDRA